MPVIKVADLAYGRLRSPDLDKQEEFLTAFGMVRADRTKTALYMRGTDAPHHLHVTELGEPKYVGIALHAASSDAVTPRPKGNSMYLSQFHLTTAILTQTALAARSWKSM